MKEKRKQMMLEPLWAVLASINRLSKNKPFVGPTLDDIKNDLKKRYGIEYTDRYLLELLATLKERGLVFKKKGLLRNGRETVFATRKGEEVVLNLLKIDGEKALVHDGWEGIVYDPNPCNINYATPSINSILMVIPPALFLIFYYCLRRLPKPTASWSCINCGKQIQSHQFNEVVICPICGQAHFLTLDKIWRFPFTNKDEYIIPTLDFL